MGLPPLSASQKSLVQNRHKHFPIISCNFFNFQYFRKHFFSKRVSPELLHVPSNWNSTFYSVYCILFVYSSLLYCLCYCISMEKDLKWWSSPNAWPIQGWPNSRMFFRALPRSLFNTDRFGVSTNSLGSVFQCLTTFSVKKFFLSIFDSVLTPYRLKEKKARILFYDWITANA